MNFLILALLCMSGQLLHYVKGQECQFIDYGEINPPAFDINDDHPVGGVSPLTYSVTTDVESVEVADYPEKAFFTFNIENNQLIIRPSPELENYFDDRTLLPSLFIKEVKLACPTSGTTSRMYNINVNVIDKNNKDTVFTPSSADYSILLPYTGVPINWNTIITVTDQDYLPQNTNVDFSADVSDVVTIISERFPAELTERLDHYNVYLYLSPDFVSHGVHNIILKATNLDTTFAAFPFTLNITGDRDALPPAFEQLPYDTNDFSNQVGQSVNVAKVTDDMTALSDLKFRIVDSDDAEDLHFTPNVGTDGTVSLTLVTEIDTSILEAKRYLIRLKLIVQDDGMHVASFPLSLRFDQDILKFTQVYYGFTLNFGSETEPNVGSVALDAPPANVVFRIEPPTGIDPYLVIDDTGAITSTRTNDELVQHNGEVDVFLVTASSPTGGDLQVPLVIRNVPDESLIPPTTTTTEATTTDCPITTCTTPSSEVSSTTECPIPTPCDCSSTVVSCTTPDSSNCPPCSTECPPSTACSESSTNPPPSCTPTTTCPFDCSTCPGVGVTDSGDDECSKTGLIVGLAIACVIAVIALGVAVYLYYKIRNDPTKDLVVAEFQGEGDLEKGSHNGITTDMKTVPTDENGSLTGRNPLARESISNTTSNFVNTIPIDSNGGAVNKNIAAVPIQSASSTYNPSYSDSNYAYPTRETLSKSEKNHEPPYSELKGTDSVDGSIYAQLGPESVASKKASVAFEEPPHAEPLVEEPKVDYKVVEFGVVEVIPTDSEDEIEVERL